MAKTSILLFYRRIFPSRKFHCAIWGLVAFTVCYSSASVLANVFSCRPISASWDIKYAGTAECINRPVFYFAQAGLGIATDFATVIAPLPMMYNLQIPMRQKIGVGGILIMGSLYISEFPKKSGSMLTSVTFFSLEFLICTCLYVL